MNLRVCHYDDNSDTSTVIDADGKTYRFNCSEIENVLVMHEAARSCGFGKKRAICYVELIL